MKYEETLVEQKKMSRKLSPDDLTLRCPICRDARPTEGALRYHLRQQHRKKRSEVENLVGIGKDELDKKRPRLSTPPRHITENEIKAPIIPSSLTEDDSHFLLSRVLSKTGTSPKRETEVKIESEESLQEPSKNYVCQCGKRFESSMSLSVHCSLVGHKFAEHFNTNQHRKTREPSDRKKILTQTLPIYCYACPRASKHTDLAEFTTHVIEKHLSIREKEKKGANGNQVTESDLRKALLRFPPTMMEPVSKSCRMCSKDHKFKKMVDFRLHILSHTEIPKYRCRFCLDKKFTANKREEIFHHIRNRHEKVLTNGTTDRAVLESCKVDPKLLWLAYGIDYN
ncbi:Oidioi.mRNA.OKI2018_I69.chr2.g7355.t1.cds [Oikopleura dioica]|uniref:Oidioi.mRNA.OKI2018_I69.chr2.g7355.t1.cds n=1 Tax=Oikopleura dioica TaxID=34765 RepID=A0ABN7TAQ0_OIKDI|nr:Oidioi.mRNA.OKI2018_I69.chr2.g7355.t1.cds [Oikopleura dioica]